MGRSSGSRSDDAKTGGFSGDAVSRQRVSGLSADAFCTAVHDPARSLRVPREVKA